MRARRLPRLVAVLALAGGFLVATAVPAWAHAVLQDSSPADQSQVARAPSQLTLTFNENVEVSEGAIRLFDCSGHRISLGSPHHGTSDRIVVTPVSDPAKLATGTYVVTWRVISADSHPVHGAFTFGIGSGTTPNLGACVTAKTTGGSTTVGVAYGVARAALFAGLALLIGGVVFMLVVAPGTTAAARARTVAWIGLVVSALATVAGVMLQGPYAEGTGIGDAFNSSVVSDTLSTRYGHVATLRILLLVAAFVILALLARSDSRKRPSWGLIVAAVVVGLGLAATPGLAGHASTGDWTGFAIVLDTLHVAAMCVWLGGLVALIVAAFGGGFSGGLRRALGAFSRVAFWCVVILVVTGLFASWRQVGFKLDGYTDTSYGNLLLVKIAIVIALVGLAAVSRSIVRARRAASLDAPDSAVAAIDEKTVKGLRKSVGGEVLLGVAVLAVTAMLVNAQPARSALAPKLFSTEIHAGSGSGAMLVDVTVDPAKVGSNAMHVYTLTPQGANLRVSNITAQFVKGNETIPVRLFRADPHHFLNNAVLIPEAGKWLIVLHIRQGEFNDTAATTPITIR